MSSNKVIIIGGIGNGTAIAAAIDDANRRGNDELVCAGFLNDRFESSETIEDYPVLGRLTEADRFLSEGYSFINTIYRIDGQEQRIKLFEDLNIPDDRLATFVHPLAYVAPNVKLAPGSVIMPNASISPSAVLGKGCLVMVSANIGHNTVVDDYCHFAAQSCVSSFVKVGKGVHVGLNASVRENLELGDWSTVAMGAVLMNNINKYEIWAGVPAKLLRLASRED